MAKKETPVTEVDAKLHLEQHKLAISTAFDRGVNVATRTVSFGQEIEGLEAFEFIDAALGILESLSDDPITIHLCCPGGDTYAALGIVGRMEASKCEINVTAFGACMSAGTLILSAGHHRKMHRFCWFMYHSASMSLSEARQGEIEDTVKQTQREQAMWCRAMSEYTKKPAKYWLSLEKSRKDHYLTAADCLKFGIVDEII